MPTQGIDVFNGQPSVVVLELAEGKGAPAASLVEQNDIETSQIEELKMMEGATTTRPAMQEKYRFAAGGAVPLPIEMVAVTSRVVAIDRGDHHQMGTFSL